MLNLNRQKTRWLLLFTLILTLTFSLSWGSFTPSQGTEGEGKVKYETLERSHSTIHTVTIPRDSGYVVVPAVSGELKLIEDFVGQDGDKVVAGINGGYFDPMNQKTTSFVVQDNQIVADPRFNERLVDNPDLKLYLGKIFNRAEFRYYDCEGKPKYDIQPHLSAILPNCTLKGSLAAGPGLLPEDTSVAEAFIAYQDGAKIRDAIGSDSLNARSAIAITAQGDIILAMAAQQPQNPLKSGVSLPELTAVLTSMGAVKAMNLDGGSSTSLYYGDRTIYGRVDKSGSAIQRPIKSVLLVKKS